MRTWNASRRRRRFRKLRWPAALPYLFASLKVGVAASLVGAIIGELPTGAVAGLGARMLSGSYYGQTVQIWAALFMAAILAAVLVGLIGLAERLTRGRWGRGREAGRDARRRWRRGGVPRGAAVRARRLAACQGARRRQADLLGRRLMKRLLPQGAASMVGLRVGPASRVKGRQRPRLRRP